MPENITSPQLRTPKAAAIAGILFAILLAIGLILVNFASRNEVSTPAARQALLLGLTLVPFAGIAFLWFVGVVRDRIGASEDRFFATVFLGSGILFLAMLFSAAAIAGSIVASTQSITDPLVPFGRQVTFTIMNIYAMKMAAVFMISTSTILLRTAILSRWLAWTGYAFALIQLVMLSSWEAIALLFPLWIFALSIEILVSSLRPSHA